ncbi:MAG: DUF2399 domain-containing protein [bacterium]|nr:DUF2399 domain-containing protein [bacterium]
MIRQDEPEPRGPSSMEKKILSVFADFFPSSAHYRGGQKLRKARWESIFPAIDSSVEVKESFLAAVDSLVTVGVLSVKWVRFREHDKVLALFLEDPVKLYLLLQEPYPHDVRLNELEILRSYKPANDIAKKTTVFLADKLEKMEPVSLSGSEHLKELLTCVSLSPAETIHCTMRALSVRLFNDSKRLESILPGFDKITSAAAGVALSDFLGLDRSFPETAIFGSMEIIFKDGRRWPCKNSMITLPLETAKQIDRIVWPSPDSKILSVENKENFYSLSSSLTGFDGFVFCGGHLNSADRIFFECLEKGEGKFFHFGDLDPDGLIIFQEIDELLKGRLAPFFMNVETYEKYRVHGYELSPGAMKRLELVKSEKVSGVADAVREWGKGVEQEVVDVSC